MVDSEAYVTGFKYDIFVSYAHVDDLLDPGVEVGWVTTLVQGLQTKLAQKLGRRDAYKIWVDQHNLAHDTHLTPQIIEILRRTATLLVILSPGYVESEWCQHERETFLELAMARAQAGWPVFIIEKEKVDARPAEFADITGYPFWVEDRDSRRKRTLGIPKPNPHDRRYYDRLEDVSEAIATKLRQIKQYLSSDSASPAPFHSHRVDATASAIVAAPRVAVFLAEVTEDLDDEHARVKSALAQAGLRVIPEGGAYPSDPMAFQEAVRTDLLQCTLFFQLLGASRGRRPEGYVQLQYDQAVKLNLPIVQWRSVALEVTTVRHEQHRALLQQETVRTTDLDDVVQEVLHRVRISAEASSALEARATVFLAEATDDLELEYDSVCAYLVQAGFRILPEAAYAHETGLYQQQVAQDIDKSDLFVQLLGRSRGRRPEGYVRLQYECAVQAHKPILQWRHPALEVTEVSPELRPLLTGSSVYVMGLEGFKREVRDTLETLHRAQAHSSMPRDVFVFVNADKKDLPLAQRVGEFLCQQGIAYALPLRQGAPAKIRKDFEENLLYCDALVIIYGSITPDWVRRQLLLLRKMQGQRVSPLRALAVCEGPPPEKSPLDFVLPNAQVIDCRNGLDTHKFHTFLTYL